jgi:uncharacterized SAM-binding protein YcdF (DUF218 family)
MLYILSIGPTTAVLSKFLIFKNDNFDKPDVIFVPGAGLSDESVSRIVKAFEFHKLYNVPVVISGYKVEARMMLNKLKNLGLDDKFIIVDSFSRNTYENVKNFLSIANLNHFKSALIISTDYHLSRIYDEFKQYRYLKTKYIPSNPIDYKFKDILDILPSYSLFYRNIRYVNEIIGIYFFRIL